MEQACHSLGGVTAGALIYEGIAQGSNLVVDRDYGVTTAVPQCKRVNKLLIDKVRKSGEQQTYWLSIDHDLWDNQRIREKAIVNELQNFYATIAQESFRTNSELIIVGLLPRFSTYANTFSYQSATWTIIQLYDTALAQAHRDWSAAALKTSGYVPKSIYVSVGALMNHRHYFVNDGVGLSEIGRNNYLRLILEARDAARKSQWRMLYH